MKHLKQTALAVLGGFILAFGLYNVHSISGVTEGGALGLMLLAEHWLGISPAWSALVINVCCYALGAKTLGRKFLFWSAVCSGSFSAFYGIFEMYPRLFPGIADCPPAAAVVGAIFVGVGIGLCVRAGGAPTGDDALAMSLSSRFRIPIERVYLLSDMTVLTLSLSYLPFSRIGWSMLSVVLSGKIIGLIQRYQTNHRPDANT